MDHQEKQILNKTSRPRGRMMDFAPRNLQKTAPKSVKIVDKEAERHELAKREYARREEIARQIERQKEEELLKKRRIAAAKQDLARRVEAERKRVEADYQRAMAERRAKVAREELERRRRAELAPKKIALADEADEIESRPPRVVAHPVRKAPRPATRPAIKPAAKPVARPAIKPVVRPIEPATEAPEEPEELLDETPEIEFDDNLFDYIDEIEKEVEAEDTSKNNARYVLGGRFPFINAEVEKRPLSGGEKTLEQTRARGRYVPYNEPIPHKNIYARTLAKEKRGRDVPTMIKSDAPKTSKISLIIAILLTIILGAVVGAIAYLAIFQ
jgi:hypothetical protein